VSNPDQPRQRKTGRFRRSFVRVGGGIVVALVAAVCVSVVVSILSDPVESALLTLDGVVMWGAVVALACFGLFGIFKVADYFIN